MLLVGMGIDSVNICRQVTHRPTFVTWMTSEKFQG